MIVFVTFKGMTLCRLITNFSVISAAVVFNAKLTAINAYMTSCFHDLEDHILTTLATVSNVCSRELESLTVTA
jgi:hypothetical protein